MSDGESSVKVGVAFARDAPEERRVAVRRAFADRDVRIDDEFPLALKSEIVDLSRIDVSFVAEVVVGGIAYDIAKTQIRRALEAAKSVWTTSGTVVVQRPEVTVWFVPDGDDAGPALDAIADEWNVAPPGTRLWVPDVGWLDQRDYWRIKESQASED